MVDEALEVVADADSGRGAGMEACKAAVPKRNRVVEAKELDEHVGDEHAEVFGIAILVEQWHYLYAACFGAGSLGCGGVAVRGSRFMCFPLPLLVRRAGNGGI